MDNQNNMTITAANSTFYLVVPGLYDRPVKIEGYSTDAMVSAEPSPPWWPRWAWTGICRSAGCPRPRSLL